MENQKPNRLIHEKSPYLHQHAYNPVNWYPWSQEAFQKAKKENKPIFLSIGYSTCHWCHVMEKESFEDEEIAKILNEHYIPIKVDREERPDIDSIYMKVCMLVTGQGGWPLTIIMTPDKKPFFAGTYFPKDSRYGRVGLKDILLHLADLWEKERDTLSQKAQAIINYIKEDIEEKEEKNIDPEKLVHRAFLELKSRFDRYHGGFGDRPKFPSPHNLMFLLRYWKRYKNSEALEMVKTTLQKMRQGGIYDHIGFGFHRYSTDEKWKLPHFEKMLYDQAMLMIVYTETYQETKETFYIEVAKEIANYIKRDMTSKEGAFYSGEDADSEGEEGKFYVWSYDELKQILKEDFELFKKIYPIFPEGNFKEEATGEISGKNIIYLKDSIENIAKKLGIPETKLKEKIEKMRKRLFKERKKRIHPLKDTKILTDWNGLMIVAFSKLAQVTGNEEYLQIAQNSADFILTNMKKEDGSLYHRYKDNELKYEATLDDYAFFMWGLFELYETSFQERYLFEFKGFLNKLFEHFWDKENGGFYMSADYIKDIIVRPQELYDGAIPSGNSVSLYNIVRFSRLLSLPDLEQKAKQIVKAFSKELSIVPSAYSMFMIGLDLLTKGTKEIIIVAEKEESKPFIHKLYLDFYPFNLTALKTSNSKLGCISGFLNSLTKTEGKPTVYICENFSCKAPIHSPQELETILKA
ncbi:MAG: thioredoxin domain-containing protein [Aquificae bacterium]|nr:thioredoxin domain-containing protein [Aquificota bacterium]